MTQLIANVQKPSEVALFLTGAQPSDRYRRYVHLLVVALLFGGFSFLLLHYFARVDVYHRHFFDHGSIVTYYNLFRVLYIFWLSWLIYFPGAALLRAIGGKAFLPSMAKADRYVAGFLAGAGIWHAVLFVIGLAGGYHRSVALLLAAIVVTASVPHLLYCLQEMAIYIRDRSCTLSRASVPSLLMMCLLGIVAAAFVAVKGLYPAGGHDYYGHYFYYYLSVIKHGSILPNEIWYHFYYCKGAGVYFLSMLLTDPLAPQLVATSFIGCGAVAIFTLLRSAGRGGMVPWLGATLYLAFLVYTPGPELYWRQGGWGELPKVHELTAVLILGALWICCQGGSCSKRARWAWCAALGLVTFAAVILTMFMAVVLGAFCGLVLTLGILRHSRPQASLGLCGLILVSSSLLLVLGLNYAYTGIPSDQLLLQSWDWLDLRKVDRWGVLDDVLLLHYGRTGMDAARVPLSGMLPLIFDCLRLDLWWPLALLGSVRALWWLLRRRRYVEGLSPQYTEALCPLILFLAGFFLICLVVSDARQEATSFYRMTSFAYGPVLCLTLLLCALLPFRSRGMEILLILGIAFVGITPLPTLTTLARSEYCKARRADLQMVLLGAKHFLNGDRSVRDAYLNQRGWPARVGYGAIYPGMEKVREVLGPGTSICTLHTISHSMLPDMELLTPYAYRSRLSVLLFATPAEGRRTLQEDGINYFFVSKELPLHSCLPVAALFAPDTIAEHLGVRWSDGTSYLLTWIGQETHPIDAAFLRRYAEQVRECPCVQGFPLKGFREVYAHFRDQGLKPFPLPWDHRVWKK